jgi:copper/silver efflux system protein
MISRIIEFSVRNRWLVIVTWLGIALWGLYAVLHTPVDAIPDLSENQVIVFADWMGRSPQDIEEQVTYPLSVQLQGLAGVRAIRSSSEPNFSMINIIFDDKTDFYFARTRVLERLSIAQASLPSGVVPMMAPDATALGQIFWYTVEGGEKSLDELRAIEDFTVKYQLNSVPGVAEVASVGGFVREYQVDVDPARLRVYDLPLSQLYSAIAASNMSVGGKVLDVNSTEYLIRGVGWLRGVNDLENVVVMSRAGVPIRLKDVAHVQLGPAFRRSALEKDGHEVVGGVVMMRVGENPLAVTQAIKQKIRDMQSGLPPGVRIVPFYDRTRLIESAIHTVTGALREEIIIASIAILLILTHFRSAVVVCVTLPMAVLVSFLFMYYLGMPSNIMSLSGIAISIGILVDASVVMVENATHELKSEFDRRAEEITVPVPVNSEITGTGTVIPSRRNSEPPTLPTHTIVTGDTTEIVIRSCRLVGRPIFFSVLIMLLSFLPVFAFGGQEGKLSHPLAFTKSFAMIGVAILAITLVPAIIPLMIKGHLRGEEENWIVRSFIHIYRPVLSWMIDRPGAVWMLMAVILSVGAGLISSPWVPSLALGAGIIFVLLGVRRFAWRITAVVVLLAVAFLADTRLRKLGSEFMPELNEGSIMDMPLTAPRVALGEAVDDIIVRDRLLRSFPEVEQTVGKVGRAETATDPSPVDMIETIVSLTPREWWPKRKIRFDDALVQAATVAAEMQRREWLKNDAGASWSDAARGVEDADFARMHPKLTPMTDLLNTATQISVDHFDRAMRDLGKRRQIEYQPELAGELVRTVYQDLMSHLRELPARGGTPAVLRKPDAEQQRKIIDGAKDHGLLLAQLPRQEEVDKLLAALRAKLIDGGFVSARNDLLLDAPKTFAQTLQFFERAVGAEPASFSQREMRRVEARRDELWRNRTRTLNWELFDYGQTAINDYLIDALHRTAIGTPFAGRDPEPAAVNDARQRLTDALRPKLFLWQKTKDDIVKEMDSELQMPGWGNVWTQPIINRVNMLATGVRTQIGVKVFGPTGKALPEAIKDVQRVSEQIADRLKTVNGAVDVTADQATGKRYVEITINRESAARYGINMTDISQAVETAMGGGQVTMTVEGRQRFPVQLRYAKDYWQDIESIRNVLVTGRTSAVTLLNTGAGASAQGAPAMASAPAASAAGMGEEAAAASPMAGGASGGDSTGGGSAQAASPGKSGMPRSVQPPSSGLVQIPLRMVADIRVVDGPSMIKSENGRLRNYVTLNVRGRDIVGFVDEARQAIQGIEQQLAGTGMTIEWSGEFENQLRARQTLSVIFPMVVVLILLLLYITFKDMLDTLLVFLAVIGALAGAVMFQGVFGFNFSVIVSIGYIAAFGMATQTGVIMLVYLREALDRRGGLENIPSLAVLRQSVIEGAVHRLRPKLLTEGVAIVGLVPMLWATGTGAEIMRPMAAPVLGGLLISDEVIDLMIPVLFYWIRRRRWLRINSESTQPATDASLRERGVPAVAG